MVSRLGFEYWYICEIYVLFIDDLVIYLLCHFFWGRRWLVITILIFIHHCFHLEVTRILNFSVARFTVGFPFCVYTLFYYLRTTFLSIQFTVSPNGSGDCAVPKQPMFGRWSNILLKVYGNYYITKKSQTCSIMYIEVCMRFGIWILFHNQDIPGWCWLKKIVLSQKKNIHIDWSR